MPFVVIGCFLGISPARIWAWVKHFFAHSEWQNGSETHGFALLQKLLGLYIPFHERDVLAVITKLFGFFVRLLSLFALV